MPLLPDETGLGAPPPALDPATEAAELQPLACLLPDSVKQAMHRVGKGAAKGGLFSRRLSSIAVDSGRLVALRFSDGSHQELPGQELPLQVRSRAQAQV